MISIPLRILGSLLLCFSWCIGAETPQPAPATAITEATPAAPVLRVMTFNIRNSSAKDGENHWSKRKELFTSTVRTFDPDLIGFQEVLADQFDDLQTLLPEYAAAGVARDDGVRRGEWAAIFYRKSRFELADAGNFWLSEQPESVGSMGWDAACVRICSWTKLRDRASNTQLLFANTHFDHKGPIARTNSARLIAERLPKIAGGAAVILSGDFNCTEESEAYKTILNTSAPGANGGHLSDSYRIVHPVAAPDEASFHAFKGTTDGRRIDWILESGDLKPVSAEIVHTASSEGRYPSDHFPVTAVFELNHNGQSVSAGVPATDK